MRRLVIRTIFLFAALAIVAGCGGGGGAAPAAPTGGVVQGYVYVESQNAPRAASAVPTGYKPVSGATVAINASGVNSTVTDANGLFQFSDVPAGSYTVTASYTGYQDLAFTVTVTAGQTTNANDTVGNSSMVLAPATTGSLALTVTTSCSAPVPFTATVIMNGETTPHTTTGTTTISGIAAPKDYSVTLLADNFQQPAAQTASIAADQTATLSFTLAPSGNPFTTITAPTTGSTLTNEGTITFTGNSYDCEDGPITGDSLVWVSSVDGIIGRGPSIQSSSLSAGEHTITLIATDSNLNNGSDSITITITGNTDPSAYIAVPVRGTTYSEGSSITFYGTGSDTEDGNLQGASLVWTSSINGNIGTGNAFTLTTLSLGTHTITLTVTDSGGRTDTDSVSITIVVGDNSMPTAVISTPTNGSYYHVGTSISFSGTGVDQQDGNLSGSSLVWFSSVNGLMGTGALIQVDSLSLGQHTISLTAMDSNGLSNTATITVTIVATGENLPPTALIATPADGASFAQGATATFSGAGTDSEDGTLSGASLVWTSDQAGQIGTGTTFQLSTLAQGTHVITLTATDSGGLSSSDTATITITEPEPNTAPTAAIVVPQNNSTFNQGAIVIFTGGATDAQDTTITGTSLVWTSSLEGGQIGTGQTFQKNNLSVGTHIITLTATDSGGLTNTSTVTITIQAGANQAPTPAIALPVNGTSVAQGTNVIFTGAAADPEDGALSGATLVWTSNVEGGQIGTGTNFTLNTLSVGNHTITLTATDSNGASAADTATLTITAP